MEKELKIDGMSCQHCVHAVREALDALPNVTVKSVEIGRAVVDATGSDESAMRAALDEEGFPLVSAEPVS